MSFESKWTGLFKDKKDKKKARKSTDMIPDVAGGATADGAGHGLTRTHGLSGLCADAEAFGLVKVNLESAAEGCGISPALAVD